MITKKRLKYLMLDLLITDGNEAIFIGVQVNMYKIIDFEYRDYYTPHVIEVEPWYKVENIKSGETKWIDKYTFLEFKRLNLIQ